MTTITTLSLCASSRATRASTSFTSLSSSKKGNSKTRCRRFGASAPSRHRKFGGVERLFARGGGGGGRREGSLTLTVRASGGDTNDGGGEEDEGDVWEDDYGMDEDDEGPSGGDNLDWRTQMKLDDLANKPAKRYQDADDDDYFMKPASASAMKDDENAWASPSNPFMSSDFSSGPDDGWFDNDDWLQPAYTEVTAEPGSILEKVQRLHLGEPADHTFQDGEYFTLTNFVKQKADNDFCLVLEVAERARERKIERLESLHPTPEINALPEIQQAIVDLALEVDASGGKTSAFLAMSEAADRARLRWELQEASWCWDNWVEEHMSQFGISERAAKLLHMGERVEDAMDFEASLYDRDDGGFPGRR